MIKSEQVKKMIFTYPQDAFSASIKRDKTHSFLFQLFKLLKSNLKKICYHKESSLYSTIINELMDLYQIMLSNIYIFNC